MINSLIVKIGTTNIYTENFGNIKNPTILLISGSMCSGRFWNDAFCNMLSNAGFFIIRYDHRDTGLSSAFEFAKNQYSMNDLVNDAVCILDTYNIKKSHILGASMGSLITQLLALDHSKRLNKIILVASGLFAPNPLNEQEYGYLISCVEKMRKNKPSKNFNESLDGFLAFWQALHGNIELDRDVAIKYTRDMYERTKPEHLDWLERLAHGLDPAHNHEIILQNIDNRTHELVKIKSMSMVVHGEFDCLFPCRIVHDCMIKYIPSTKTYIIPKMGHIVFNDELFSKLAQMSIDFLSSEN